MLRAVRGIVSRPGTAGVNSRYVMVTPTSSISLGITAANVTGPTRHRAPIGLALGYVGYAAAGVTAALVLAVLRRRPSSQR